MTIVLTQSEDRLEGLVEALAAQGHEVVRAPLVRTATLQTPEARAATRALLGGDWLLFSSRAGVRAWHELGLDFSPNSPKLGAVGAATAREIEAFGGRAILVGEPQNAEGLAACFLKRAHAPARVGLVQGTRAQPTLGACLSEAGHEVRVAAVYATFPLPWQEGVASGTVRNEALVVLLASPSAVRALPERVAARARLVALGPSTSRAVRARGWQSIEASRPDAAAVMEVLAGLDAPFGIAEDAAKKHDDERRPEDDC